MLPEIAPHRIPTQRAPAPFDNIKPTLDLISLGVSAKQKRTHGS
jgi:hypothetical protein